MNTEKIIKNYKENSNVLPREEHITDTILKSKEAFYRKEQERLLNYWEFLWSQFRITKKRWWLFQIMLLTTAVTILPSTQSRYTIQRIMGVVGVLFVVLVIPELWKNKSCNSAEIEISSYYTLKQIYAARILLYGIVDIFLLTVFCVILKGNLHFTFTEILVQFLFPITITACICFGILCNKYSYSEITSIVACIIWSTIWMLITINENIYEAAVLPVWLLLFVIAILFLAAAVYKTLHDCNKCLEVNFNGIKDN